MVYDTPQDGDLSGAQVIIPASPLDKVTDKTRTMEAEERRRTAQMFAGLADYLGEEDTRKLMEIMERVSSYLDQQIEAGPKGNCSGRERRSQQGGNREE